MDDLSPRQRNMIALAEYAESYIKHKQRQRPRSDQSSSLSHREYDVDASRREWEQSFQ